MDINFIGDDEYFTTAIKMGSPYSEEGYTIIIRPTEKLLMLLKYLEMIKEKDVQE